MRGRTRSSRRSLTDAMSPLRAERTEQLPPCGSQSEDPVRHSLTQPGLSKRLYLGEASFWPRTTGREKLYLRDTSDEEWAIVVMDVRLQRTQIYGETSIWCKS